jgi:hypothetical protein
VSEVRERDTNVSFVAAPARSTASESGAAVVAFPEMLNLQKSLQRIHLVLWLLGA